MGQGAGSCGLDDLALPPVQCDPVRHREKRGCVPRARAGEEEVIILSRRTLAAVAQLQDPTGFRLVANAGTTPWTSPERWQAQFSGTCSDIPDSDALGREEEEQEEEVINLLGSRKLGRDGIGFKIYEDSSSVASGKSLGMMGLGLQSMKIPGKPSVHLYSTPPPLVDGADPLFEHNSSALHTRDRDSGSIAPGSARDILRETGNQKVCTAGSWSNLVQLTGSRACKAGRLKSLNIMQKLHGGKAFHSAGPTRQEKARMPTMSPRALAGNKHSDQEDSEQTLPTKSRSSLMRCFADR